MNTLFARSIINLPTDKRDYYKTAREVGSGEFVAVEHLGDDIYYVTFQSGSTAFMPAEEDGTIYLDRFCL